MSLGIIKNKIRQLVKDVDAVQLALQIGTNSDTEEELIQKLDEIFIVLVDILREMD